ncbi:hypothetical protein [Rhizobium sp. NXC24]|uniref:hypothetical protein n=1 Tax=Rhizobium sp. NXC24 TaxID=2048897 RepID=UPI000CDF5076|nr:hypothetical protein [Rhizobium sp. NXC24]AVA25002.1 hypothetical protein NXC24_PC00557 [Rhizobium sp. NXC24]
MSSPTATAASPSRPIATSTISPATANGAVDLIAGDSVNILSINDVTNASEMQKKSFAGVSVTVSSQLISAAQFGVQAASLRSGDNGVYGIAPAVSAGVNGYEAISQTGRH